MEKLIQQAHDRGCTFFDTAEGYSAGSNEELLGRAVAPFRDKVIIGTKFTVDLTKNPPINDNRPERVKAACGVAPTVEDRRDRSMPTSTASTACTRSKTSPGPWRT